MPAQGGDEPTAVHCDDLILQICRWSFCGFAEAGWRIRWVRGRGLVMDLVERHLRSQVVEALHDTRVVVVLGARQVGKSTMVPSIAEREHSAGGDVPGRSGDREAASNDSTGFGACLRTPVVIDEVQRVPDLLLAIKVRVDRDPAPGQFLLTG